MTCKHDEFYAKLCALVHRYTDSLSPLEVAYLLIGEGTHILYMCATPEYKEESIKALIEMAVDAARKDALQKRELENGK